MTLILEFPFPSLWGLPTFQGTLHLTCPTPGQPLSQWPQPEVGLALLGFLAWAPPAGCPQSAWGLCHSYSHPARIFSRTYNSYILPSFSESLQTASLTSKGSHCLWGGKTPVWLATWTPCPEASKLCSYCWNQTTWERWWQIEHLVSSLPNPTRAAAMRVTYVCVCTHTHTHTHACTPGERTTTMFEKLESEWKSGTNFIVPQKWNLKPTAKKTENQPVERELSRNQKYLTLWNSE